MKKVIVSVLSAFVVLLAFVVSVGIAYVVAVFVAMVAGKVLAGVAAIAIMLLAALLATAVIEELQGWVQ